MTETGKKCSTCQADIKGKYCQECGSPAELKRIDVHYLLHEIEHIFHVERGFIYTVRSLLHKPGETVQQFILKSRNRLVKPVIFLIVTSLLYSIAIHYFQIEDGYVQADLHSKSTTEKLFVWVQNHYGYANILMGAIIALWIKLFFRKYSYNYFEILVLLCYTMGLGMLIYTVFAVLDGLTHIKLMQISSVIALLYCSWAIGQFYEKKRWMSYVKSFFAYILGFLTFSILIICIGVIIDRYL